MKLQVNKQRSRWWIISAAILISGLIAMLVSWAQIGSPLRPGLDFIGGTRLQYELDCQIPNNCSKPIDVGTVRQIVDAQGLTNSSIQVVGQYGLSVRTKERDLKVEQRTQLEKDLSEKIGTFDPNKTQIDTVGPTVGRQLLSTGLLALMISFFGIIVYMTVRFELDYAIFAIVALFHDVWLTAGFFAIFGVVLGVEVDSLFIVALLTIIGFSVNDTVVIYDRIREIISKDGNRAIADIVDDAVNQTLARSINTTLTVLLTLLSIFLFGGETLKYFALALIIGFSTGAYSSIFIASSLLAWWRERTGRGIPAPAEGLSQVDATSSNDASSV
ncbi:protein translocase subunit SecF [Aerosakkonema funiforme]|uniref:Protein-export membrane protein SecF n=1 Tax=Aerosakkonema funiforme FACHB-1375 TaxID=2949571 RepID=A0A926ZGK0_9CYAN|nr:protein translocase subunit SecF [Aerosakkonema funiforme]MBD2181629.1 protein translocase subunit SecF [Aerosakkonema funiforme FACHB-1375]